MTVFSAARFQQAGRAILYLLLFCIPFSNAAIEILFPILLVAWWVGWKPLSRRRSPEYGRVLFPLLAYLGICIGSLAYSQYPRISVEGLIGKTFEYALLFLIAADIACDPKVPERSLRFLFLAGGLVVLYALLQEWAIHHPIAGAMAVDPITHKQMRYTRMVGPYKNPNDLATFLMVIALTALGVYSLRLPRQSGRTLSLGLAATSCLIWTKSLGALLGFLTGVPVILALARRRSLWIAAGVLLLLALGLAVAVEPHLLQVLTLADDSSQERRAMWLTAWNMIRERPWRGLGINTFMANYQAYAPDFQQAPAYAHNCFLQIAAETGALGLITFLWFLTNLFLAFARTRPMTPAMAGWMAALAAFLVQSAFDTNLYVLRQAALFWTLAGAAFGASRRSAQGQDRPGPHAAALKGARSTRPLPW